MNKTGRRSPQVVMKLCIMIPIIALLISPVGGFVASTAGRYSYFHIAATTGDEVDLSVNLEIADADSITCYDQELERRQFFATIMGAASMLALSDTASASDEISSSTLMVIADTQTGEAAKVPVDIRAIFDKAVKKALGGE